MCLLPRASTGVTSGFGTSRHFAALQDLVAIGGIADLNQAASSSVYEYGSRWWGFFVIADDRIFKCDAFGIAVGVAAIALANKLARMVWAMMAKNERYKEPAALTA